MSFPAAFVSSRARSANLTAVLATPAETQKALPLLYRCPCVPLLDEQQGIEVLDRFVSSRSGGYSVAVNAEKMLFYGTQPKLRSIIDRSALPYPDGVGAVLALRWLHGRAARKIDMPSACLSGAQRKGWRLFILGATEAVNRAAVGEIERRYPGIHLVGRLNGYEPDEAKLAAIAAAKPDIVMVALGSPRQELFAAHLVTRVPGIFAVGCGGALDILAGNVRRAPPFMMNNGLEWLYRLWKEPARWRRQLVLPGFLFKLILAVLRTRLVSHSRASS
jgi:N-acetylglucosaminyldiphosphoundecaprenol N-acetyl-beta-D-mannosaminyltransferase